MNFIFNQKWIKDESKEIHFVFNNFSLNNQDQSCPTRICHKLSLKAWGVLWYLTNETIMVIVTHIFSSKYLPLVFKRTNKANWKIFIEIVFILLFSLAAIFPHKWYPCPWYPCHLYFIKYIVLILMKSQVCLQCWLKAGHIFLWIINQDLVHPPLQRL